jgi:formylglycine-generating enzyme required for sulfatase activity
MAANSTPPKVFISYAWEDDIKAWVLDFATRLRSDGINAILDQWETAPGDQLTEFMEKSVRESDFVVFVCTPTYKRKSDRRKGGVGYEGSIITGEVFAKNNHRKFIPILRKGKWTSAAPSWATSKLFIDLRNDPYNEMYYQQLLNTLFRKSPTAPPVWDDTLREIAKREATEKVAREQAEKEAAEKARLEAEELAKQKAAKEKAERELAEKDAREKIEREAAENPLRKEEERDKAEKAEQDELERQLAEKEAREKAEREKAEKAARDKLEQEAAEKAKREKAEREASERIAREKSEREVAENAAREKIKRDAAEKSAKYPLARLKGMQEFMEFTRDANWEPSLIDISLLKKLGIAKGKEGLVIQALRFLRIIDDAGIPTNEFDNLKRDYQATLKHLVQESYSELLSSIPLSKANQIRLVSYFGNPVDTAEYQAKLFVWFCEQSGIALPKNDIEEKLALEKVAQEKQEREAAQEKAKREATEKAKREKAERRTAQIRGLKQFFSNSFTSFKLAISKAKPLLRIVGIIGIILVLLWGGSWAMPQVLALFPTPTDTVTPHLTITAAPSSSPVPFTRTVEPSKTPTKVMTATPTVLPTEITDTKGVTMMLVPAGEFMMGSNNGDANEKPVHQVYLDAFYMDKYEVTNALYQACVTAGVCTYYGGIMEHSITRPDYYTNPKYESYPVVNVFWNNAKTYCEWRGARLPTEAEWEKAARGTDERTYPWGEGIACSYANYNNCRSDTTEVGSYEIGKSPYGIYDMAGNVWEWVNDMYRDDYYQNSPLDNPLGPDSGNPVLRGGAWFSSDFRVRSADRDIHVAAGWPNYYGFRCARDANP